MQADGEARPAGTTARVDRWLVWGIRISAAWLLLAVLALSLYYYQQRYTHATVSIVDRDIQIIESQIRQRPADQGLRVAIANLYVERGRHDDAVAQAEQVLQVNPHHMGALLSLAQAAAGEGRRDLAISYLQRAVADGRDAPLPRVSPQLALVHQQLGSLYLDLGQASEAVDQLRRALELDRSNADTLSLLGKALVQLGQLDEAIQSYQQALRLVPDFPAVYAALYRAYQSLGDRRRADFAQGMMHYGAGDFAQAEATLQRVVQTQPEMAEASLGLAMTFEKQGQRQRALEYYRLALAIDGSSIAARQGVARLGGQP